MLFYWLTRNWINGFLSEHELTNGYWSQSHELRSHWSRHRSRNHPRIRRPGYSSQTRLRPVNIPSPVMCHARTFALPRKKTKFPLPEVDSDSENAPRIRPRSSSPTSALEMRPPFGDWPMLGCCLFFFCTAGRQNDKDGKTTTSWWSDDTLSQYLLRAQCFVDQYSNYSLVADAAVGPIQVKK